MEKIAVGLYLSPKSKLRLEALAELDKRSKSTMFEWLIDQEYTRRAKKNAALAEAEKEETNAQAQ